jgi:hypothetical protein
MQADDIKKRQVIRVKKKLWCSHVSTKEIFELLHN